MAGRKRALQANLTESSPIEIGDKVQLPQVDMEISPAAGLDTAPIKIAEESDPLKEIKDLLESTDSIRSSSFSNGIDRPWVRKAAPDAAVLNGTDGVPREKKDLAASKVKMALGSMVNDRMQSLPEKERVVLNLCYFEEFEPEQIAQMLDIPIDKVSEIIERGLRDIRKAVRIEH